MFLLKRVWPLPFGVLAGLAIWAGCQTGRMAPAPAAPIAVTGSGSLHPGPDDPRIAFVAARLLEEYHYLQHPLDKEMSAKFYDGYIDSLDPRHEYFLQSDLDEFAPYRTNLDTLTINTNLASDLSPAYKIYERYQERFQQRVAYESGLLQQDKFKFNTDDKIYDRHHEPFPKDLDEAQALWRQRLRFDYLVDKLSREISDSNGVFSVKLPPGAATNIVADLEKHNRWSLHLMTNQDSDSVLTVYLNALAHAYDPHSDYFSAPHAQDFSIQMNLALFGIGAQLTEDDGYCTIHSLVAGGPAAKSKAINEKDRIVAVAQANKPPVDVVDMDLEKVVQQIRGPKGTEVRLTILPAPDFTKRKVITLVRDEIKLEDSEAKAKIIETPDFHGGTNRIGVLNLPSFYAPVESNNGRATPKYTSVDVAKLLEKLKREHVSGLIVDLRFNPGGSLEEAIKFTGLFIKDGPVVQARNSDGQVVVESCTDGDQVYAGPLVVLVNRFSASAAEIAAAALQDYGRAIVVGDISTHGKGTVQQLDPLKPFMINTTNDPGELKVTIRKFYRITGASTQLKGVMPDIVLPDIFNYSKQIGESNLDNPLAWDTIQPANYDKMNLVQPYIADLHARSDARVLTNQDFTYVRQDIEQYEKTQADRMATLNEHEAIKEHEEEDARNRVRGEERENRPDPGIKIYEITVKDAGESKLPAPENWLGQTNGLSLNGRSQSSFELQLDKADPWQKHLPFGWTNGVSAASVVVQEPAEKTAGTNSVSSPGDKKIAPPFDPVLDESEHILEDYISVLQKSGNLTVNP